MANFNKNNVSYTAAKVYISEFDPTSDIALGIPALTTSVANDNVDDVIAYIEANYSFERMAGFKNAKITESFDNEVIDEVDDCDIGEWQKTSELTPSFAGDWLTTLDLHALKILTGVEYFAKAGTLVTGFVQAIPEGTWAQGVFKRFGHQSYSSGAIVSPASIVLDDGNGDPLVLDTDYIVVTNEFGEYGIIVLDTVDTDEDQDLELTYNYTPTAAEFAAYQIGQTIQPYMVVKIITCPDENAKSDTFYIVKANLSGALDTSFISSGEVPLSSITLQGAKGGYMLKQRNRI